TENSGINPGGYSGGRFDGNGQPETVPNGITPEVIALAKLLYSQGYSVQRGDGEKLLRTARDRAEPYRRSIVYPPQCSDNKYFVLCLGMSAKRFFAMTASRCFAVVGTANWRSARQGSRRASGKNHRLDRIPPIVS